jgi:dipeptidyl aminopeptidase/acylaminoacyl peptidase
MTFEEVLADQRAVRSAWFSPAGDAVLVSLERNDRPTGGAPWKLTGTQATVWRLADGAAHPLGGPDKAFLPSPCEPWSPSGRYVAGFVLDGGRKALAVFDLRRDRLVRFTTSPTVQCVRWVGERLVFPATAPGAPTLGGSAEVAAVRQLARWRAAWFGAAPQVTVHASNPAVAGSAPAASGGLMLADPATGTAQLIARGGYHSVTPSPDGRRLAVARYGADALDALSTRTGRRSELQLFEATAGGLRLAHRLDGYDVDYASLAWSADGSQVLAAARPVGGRRDGLVAMEAATGRPTDIALPAGLTLARAPAGAYSRYRAGGWIGRSPAFLGVRAGDPGPPAAAAAENGRAPPARLFVWSGLGVAPLGDNTTSGLAAFAGGPDTAVFVADGRLWSAAPGQPAHAISPADLTVISLVEAHPSMGLAPTWARRGERVAVRVQDGAGTRTVVFDMGAARVRLQAVQPLALDPALDKAVSAARAGWTTTLFLSGRTAPLATFNAAWRDRPTAPMERFSYRVGDRELTGWIVHPLRHTVGPPPALLWIYGGQMQTGTAPREASAAYAGPPVFAAQLWAARGYAVIYPSTPAPAGADADVADALAQAAVAAVDQAAAAGWVDPARVGVIGHSFGGFSAAAVLSRRSDRFAAGVAMSGDYDYAAAWALRGPWEWMQDDDNQTFRESTVGLVEAGQIGLRAPPFATPELYRRASPFYAAPEIHSPLLLTVGDLEAGATGLAQAERFYAALKRSGNPAVLARYWGQGHVQDAPWASRDQWERFNAWFDRYLGAPDTTLTVAPPGSRPGPASASSAPRIR